jgi:putative heme-binding domain-containing protein
VEEDGVTFKARRAGVETDPEFIASEDQWFRPVMARMGPDGAIWVVDMYRYMIEHPDWLPAEGRKELAPFYREGENRGRIYRISRKGNARAGTKALPRLDRMTPQELAATLESSNGWLRDKAQQLLIWQGDRSVAAAIERLASESHEPATRLQSLCTLEGLRSLSRGALLRGLKDAAPQVRRHSIRLAESFAKRDSEVNAAMAAMVDDSDSKVRLQLACSLGEWPEPWAGPALAALAIKSGRDPYIAAAMMSSAVPHAQTLVDLIAAKHAEGCELLVEPLLSLSVSLGRRDLAAKLLATMTEPIPARLTAEQWDGFARFLDLLARRDQTLKRMMDAEEDALAIQLRKLAALFAAARQIASDPQQPAPKRAAATGLLGREETEREHDLDRLASLLDPAIPGEVQIVAVKALAANGSDRTAEVLLKEWTAQGPEARSSILDALLTREKWTMDFLVKVGQQQIPALDVDARHRDRMLKSSNEGIRSLAATLFASGSSTDRQKVIESYRSALALAGDPVRGKVVFGRLCVACHQLDGVGREVGPNLISVKAHPPEKLLTSILDPSREVEPRFLAYNCVLKGGEELYGLIAGETGNGIVFKLVDGSTRNVLRGDIVSLRSTKNSLMPDGLETGMSLQDTADLIRYLRYQPGAE